MSFQSDLYAALSGIAAGGAFPNATRTTPANPYIVYSTMTTPENTLANGEVIQHARVQIDVYSLQYEETQSLKDSIKSAIKTNFPQSVLLLAQDLYEDAVKLHRVMQEFSISHY
jgi:hypothetical protein